MNKDRSLTPDIVHIVRDKGTETPFAGLYTEWDGVGTFLCRRCGLSLFRSQTQFHSGCGWPSFDEEIVGTVNYIRDADGKRTEILCMRCEAHLGHVFQGENFTYKNTRHCVNSASLDFIKDTTVLDTKEGIFAAGCFWGVEAEFTALKGVLKTEVGYTGGHLASPSYEKVCHGQTGHFEAVRVIYDPEKIEYADLINAFFLLHNPTQVDGQGADRGEQYRSVIFYYDTEQQKTAQDKIKSLTDAGQRIMTQIQPVSVFWPAEAYHQQYYGKRNKS